MSASGGMSQLLKGIIIGVVLIMAIIGTMSLLGSKNPLSSLTNGNTDSTKPLEIKEIIAPAITMNPDSTQNPSNNNDNSSNIGDLNAEIVDDTLENTNTDESVENTVTENDGNSVKPVLENERTIEEATKTETAPVNFGMMALNTVNPANNQALKANYKVFDKDNKVVAESRDVSNSSFRLPSGQYKVEATLMRIDEATKKNIPVITKSRYIIVRTNNTANQTFELEPPATTGVLQVSAKIKNQIIRANFVIQKANGEIVASRNNVTNSLFKLDTGSYKVSVTSGNNEDFRSVEVKAGESTQTVFILKEAATQGKLLVRVFETRSSNPIRANITITDSIGGVVQDLKATTQTELTLLPGNYKISVVGPNGTSNKNVRVNSGQALNEIFRFDKPEVATSSTNTADNNSTQINENVTIKPVENQTIAPEETVLEPIDTNGSLSVIAQDELTKKSIKSNIYIQNMQGKHLDKKTYVDSASFSLKPGVYKVTVRAKNRKNNVKTIRVSQNQKINETFLLSKPDAQIPQPAPANNTTVATQTTEAIKKPKGVIPTGFLNVAMRAPNNQQSNRNSLRSDFIVTTTTGKKIVELSNVPAGNFKLDVGSYIVTAINNNKTIKRRVSVKQNQNTRLNFNTADFIAAKGILRSRIIDDLGRALKGNLIVTNAAGQVVARANQVSSAVFNLIPVRHTISVNFQGLSGSEVVKINANETTVQTFTIASDRNTGQNNNQPRNQQRDVRDILKEKIRKEIQRTF